MLAALVVLVVLAALVALLALVVLVVRVALVVLETLRNNKNGSTIIIIVWVRKHHANERRTFLVATRLAARFIDDGQGDDISFPIHQIGRTPSMPY